MKDLFAPNRVAVLTALLGAIAAAIATLLGAVDSTPKAIVVAVALLAVAAVIIVYLLGSQKHEARTFAALKPAEQNAVAVDEAPVAAWAASPAGQAAAAANAPPPPTPGATTIIQNLTSPSSTPSLSEPDDLADEDDQYGPVPIGGLETQEQHSHLGDDGAAA